MNLYSITQEYRQQLAALADLDMPPEVVADTVEGMQGDLENKLRAVIAFSLNLRAEAAAQKTAAQQMAERFKATESRVDGLLAYALKAMQDTGIGEVSTDEFAAKVAKNPASVNVIDAALIPAAYLRTPEPPAPAPDKVAIAAAMKTGAVVPGCELVQGFRLALK
jgi:Siphovirus Gp157